MNKSKWVFVYIGMKTLSHLSRFKRMGMVAVLIMAIGLSPSCMRVYDANGRPVQAVDPGIAIAGAAVALMVGAAISNNRHDNQRTYAAPRDDCRPRHRYY